MALLAYRRYLFAWSFVGSLSNGLFDDPGDDGGDDENDEGAAVSDEQLDQLGDTLDFRSFMERAHDVLGTATAGDSGTLSQQQWVASINSILAMFKRLRSGMTCDFMCVVRTETLIYAHPHPLLYCFVMSDFLIEYRQTNTSIRC